MISTQMAADIINCAFKTEFCMFKVNKFEFNFILATTCHPVEASKLPKHTQKQKQDGSLGAFFKVKPASHCTILLKISCDNLR